MFEDWHRAMYNSTRNMSIFFIIVPRRDGTGSRLVQTKLFDGQCIAQDGDILAR